MKKSNILFLYETSNNTPNGDPFTGEQRYDQANQKIMVSDVRIKRFIRDLMIDKLLDPVYVKFDSLTPKDLFKAAGVAGFTGASVSFRQYLLDKGEIKKLGDTLDPKKFNKETLRRLLLEFIDVRLFGGLLTDKESTQAVQGAVQFNNMSYSLNEVQLETRQITTTLPSEVSKGAGSIGTASYVPYAIIAINGWLDEMTAEKNNLSDDDLEKMFFSLWVGVRDKITQSKANSRPLLLMQFEYKGIPLKYNPSQVVYHKGKDLNKLISIETDILETEIRSREDYRLNFDKLIAASQQSNVETVKFFTEDAEMYAKFSKLPKFEFMELIEGTVEILEEDIASESLIPELV
jgi:CRISPR-associated protein Csh2